MADFEDNNGSVLGIQATINGQGVKEGADDWVRQVGRMGQATEEQMARMNAALDLANQKFFEMTKERRDALESGDESKVKALEDSMRNLAHIIQELNIATKSNSTLKASVELYDEYQQILDELANAKEKEAQSSETEASAQEKLNEATQEGAKATQEETSATNENTEATNENAEATNEATEAEEKNTEAVEKNSKSLLSWVTGNGRVKEGVGELVKGLNMMPVPLANSAKGLATMAAGMWKLVTTPLGAVITAIVLGLKAMYEWLTKDADGQKAFAQVSAYIGSLLSSIGDIAATLGKFLFSAFQGADAPMRGFADGLKTTFVTALRAAGEVLIGFGKILKGAFTLDGDSFTEGVSSLYDGVKDAASAAVEAAKTAVKGITGIAKTASMALGDEKLAKSLSDEFNNMQLKANMAANLAKRQVENDIAATEARIKAAELDKEIAKHREKVYQLTGKERAEEIAITKELMKQKYDAQIKAARESYEITKETNSLHTSSLQDLEKERQLRLRLIQTEASQLSSTMMMSRMEASTKRQIENEGKQKTSKDNAIEQGEHRLSEAERKAEIASRRRAEDEYVRVREAAIKAERDVDVKAMLERELQHDNEMRQIERETEDLIEQIISSEEQIFNAREEVEAKKNKEYKKRIFNRDSDLSLDAIGQIATIRGDEAVKKDSAEAFYFQQRMQSYDQYATQVEKNTKEQEKRERMISDMEQFRLTLQQRGDNESVKIMEERIRLANVLKGITEETTAEWDYLMQYGTGSQKRQATIDSYNAKIAESTARFGSDSVQVRTLQKQMNAALSDLDFTEMKSSIDWDSVFGDVSNLTKKELDKIKSQLRTFMESVNPEDDLQGYKQLSDAMQKLESASVEISSAFPSISDAMNQYKLAADNVRIAEINLNDARALGDTEAEAMYEKELELAKIRKAEAKSKVDATKGKVQNDLNNLNTLISGLTGGNLLGSAGGMTSAAMNLFGGEKTKKNSEKIGSIVGMFAGLTEAIAEKGFGGFLKEAFSNIGDAFGSVFGDIGKIFGADNFLGGLFGSSDKKLAKDTEALTKSNSELKEAINKLSDKFNDAFGADAAKLNQQQESYIKQSQANTAEMLKRNAAAYSNGFMSIGGTHSSNSKINDAISRSEWARISSIVGTSVRSASDFWNLTSKQMYEVSANAGDLYAKIKSASSSGYKDISKYMDDYIEYWKQLENNVDSYNSKLTGVSFDEFKNGFLETLMDMDSSASDFANNLSQTFAKAMTASLVGEKYKHRLEDFYNKYAGAMESGFELTDDEVRNLKQEYQKIVEDAISDRNGIAKITGYDDAYSQQASTRGFQAMSQDTAEELNGRFTALQISGESILSQMTEQSAVLDMVSADTAAIRSAISTSNEYISEIRDIQQESVGILSEIKKDTAHLVYMRQELEQIRNNTSRL